MTPRGDMGPILVGVELCGGNVELMEHYLVRAVARDPSFYRELTHVVQHTLFGGGDE